MQSYFCQIWPVSFQKMLLKPLFFSQRLQKNLGGRRKVKSFLVFLNLSSNGAYITISIYVTVLSITNDELCTSHQIFKLWWLSQTDLDNLLMHFHFFLSCVITNLSSGYWKKWCFKIDNIFSQFLSNIFSQDAQTEQRPSQEWLILQKKCLEQLGTLFCFANLYWTGQSLKKVLWGYRNDFICFEVLEKMHYVVKSLLWDYLCSFLRDRIFAALKRRPKRKVVGWDGSLFDAFGNKNPTSIQKFLWFL